MRNTNSYFSFNADVDIRRSKWRAPYNKKFTMSAGKLYPFCAIEVLPGDTISLPNMHTLTRMTTPIHPVMDNAYQDIYWFFIPNRLVMDDWQAFMGENTEGEWLTDMPDVQMPMLYLEAPLPAGATPKSAADYLGLPTWVNPSAPENFPTISGDYRAEYQAIPFRDVALLWNEWFRPQATHPPIPIYKDDISRPLSNPISYSGREGDYMQTLQFGGALPPVAKFADYFTTALPAPQKGEDVTIGFGSSGISAVQAFPELEVNNEAAMKWQKISGTLDISERPFYIGTGPSQEAGVETIAFNETVNSSASTFDYAYVAPSNLGVANSGIDITINQLRIAFQVQKFLEKQAMYGSRYTEIIRSFFGVTSPDSRLQRSEYIGGQRIPVNMQQVLQTSATNDISPQGNTAAFSLTARSGMSMFQYSSTEHGFIIGVTCIRTSQTYQYGVRRMWSRKDRLDYYFPTFANIGNTPILNKEIYQTFTDQDEEVFGYQEAWAEYRYLPSEIAGEFRSQYAQSLDSWHYAEKLTSTPTLSEEFMNQSAQVVDRTLAVSSQLADQFYCDFFMSFDFVRPMPVYSVPGLVDHH